MKKPMRIHRYKQPIRRHFLVEWLEAKGMTPADLLRQLNDPERSMEFAEVDKSQIYRWMKGQMPNATMQQRIADALNMDSPEYLLRSPEDGWLMEFFKGRTKEDRERARRLLEAAFDEPTGTDD